MALLLRIHWRMLALMLLALTGCRDAVPPAPALPAAPRSVQPAIAERTGTASCSNRGCHGGFPQQDEATSSRSSFSRWHEYDPHANAYLALSSPLGKQIGEKLGIDVTQEPRCIVCHATPQAATDTAWAREERTFGVGCEACHGSATKWLVPHRAEDWASKSDAEKLAHGMQPISRLSVRAKVCAGCHVGAPADTKTGIPVRDVDHDFIAAGHPRLMFEFGAFLANLPKHWTEKDQRPDFEARVWLVGQVASADAALDLLIGRAASQRAWPEFAEFDCYACHQNLEKESRRVRGKGKLGSIRPSRWYYGQLTPITGVPMALDVSVPPHRVSEEAKTVQRSLAGLTATLEERKLTAPDLIRLRGRLVKGAIGRSDLSWDEAEQIALGIKALVESERAWRLAAKKQPDTRSRQIEATSEALLRKLAFPVNRNSPDSFRRTADFDRELDAMFAELGQD